MVIKSFAKINLALKLIGRQANGYHQLEMINLPIDLRDVIEISLMPKGCEDSYFTTDNADLAALPENLTERALNAMRDFYGFTENFEIFIHKDIPFKAGLGGGSSNAACVMKAINQILKLNAKKEDLLRIAVSIGADVPYFLDPKPALVRGIGEDIEPIRIKNRYECLIIKPDEGLSTHDVFEASENFPHSDMDVYAMVKALEEGDDDTLKQLVHNDLFLAANSLCPKIGEIIEELKADGADIVSMSGSGTTVFALTSDQKKCRELAKKYKMKEGMQAYQCKILY